MTFVGLPFATLVFIGGWLEFGLGAAIGCFVVMLMLATASIAVPAGFGTFLHFSVQPALVVWVEDQHLCFRTNSDYAKVDLKDCIIREGRLSECAVFPALSLPANACLLVEPMKRLRRKKVKLAVGHTPSARLAWLALFNLACDKQEPQPTC